ncbi:hypothetical protein [Alkalicoccobacillus plakortidis]|uniref:Uncharacterized protein n=1 Tax=Alkalicoccobacillus plakortidis TaxID=444060 RepID=A0ABT0XI19_9BACI|nr:hypothetical protein [Alkalicoccobacillus plakortidis]MCM2675560.1 hypothetical protein [Alkalicoccobacillus plakortidis]
MVDYWTRPTLLENWDEGIDTIMAIDENGTPDLKYLKKLKVLSSWDFYAEKIKPNTKWFTASGVILERENFQNFKKNFMDLKHNFWENAEFQYKDDIRRIVFHSREIRNKIGPFDPRDIDNNQFLQELTQVIKKTPFSIYSSTINKYELVKRYHYPMGVYDLSLNFIVERYAMMLNNTGRTGLLFIEARGKKRTKKY